MAEPVTFTLVSSTPTAGWRPNNGSEPLLELTGAGSCTVTVEYKCLDGSWAPNATGTDGGAPIILDKLAYAGTPIRLSLDTGREVRVSPGVVTNTVTATFVNG